MTLNYEQVKFNKIEKIIAWNQSLYTFGGPKGSVAERLGRSLQNFVQRFKSARNLKSCSISTAFSFIGNSKI